MCGVVRLKYVVFWRGRSVGGGNADNVMSTMQGAPRSCDGEDRSGEETYAFFAQLNMIADVI